MLGSALLEVITSLSLLSLVIGSTAIGITRTLKVVQAVEEGRRDKDINGEVWGRCSSSLLPEGPTVFPCGNAEKQLRYYVR